MFDYDPDKVRAIVEEVESQSLYLSNSDLVTLQAIKDSLDKNEEIPRALLVKLSMLSRKVRR